MFVHEAARRGIGEGPMVPTGSAGRQGGALSLLTAVTSGLSIAREPRALREQFEQQVRRMVRARSVVLQDAGAVTSEGAVSFEVPTAGLETRARLEVALEGARGPDEWTRELLETAAHVAALLLEIERGQGRYLRTARLRPDGAAPLIGSSRGIRLLRDRIERVAATDFTVLVEGGFDPQPHPNFIEVFCPAAFG